MEDCQDTKVFSILFFYSNPNDIEDFLCNTFSLVGNCHSSFELKDIKLDNFLLYSC